MPAPLAPTLTTFVIDNIGTLVTNHPEIGAGPLGLLHDVSLVISEGNVVSIGPTGQLADERIDARGRCVLPGFVDSHAQLVFAQDRRVGTPAPKPDNGAGRVAAVNAVVQGTRATTEQDLRDLILGRVHEAHRAGTTTLEIKSGFGFTVEDESRSLRLASEVTSETTFFALHVPPIEYADKLDEYVDLVCTEMLNEVLPNARWIDTSCEPGAFDFDQCRVVLEAGRSAGLGLRMQANQFGYGPGVQLAVELGAASVGHCIYLDDADREALRSSTTVATFLPGNAFATASPYPDARRALDAGVQVALSAGCSPVSGYSPSLPFCVSLAVRDMGMTVEEAISAITTGGARALQRYDVGHLSPGAKGHVVILDTPSYHDLAYRPGVPVIAQTIGRQDHDLIG